MRPDCTTLGPAVLRAVEQRRGGVYSSLIDLWPDDWAASLRTAGRTFRLPLQMIDPQPHPFWGAALMHPAVKGYSNGDRNCEVVQRTEGLWLHSTRPGRQGRV